MIRTNNNEHEKRIVKAEYENMYCYMIDKDIDKMNSLFDDSFTITHKNGTVQNKEVYIRTIADGGL